jgi:hypothetical protein
MPHMRTCVLSLRRTDYSSFACLSARAGHSCIWTSEHIVQHELMQTLDRSCNNMKIPRKSGLEYDLIERAI